MPRLMTVGPVRDFIYYAGMTGMGIMLTYLMYLYISGQI